MSFMRKTPRHPRLMLALALVASCCFRGLATEWLTDYWDRSRGSAITGSSEDTLGTLPNMFGGDVFSGEPGVAFFRDDQDAGFVHWVEWQTATPIILTGYVLGANSDDAQLPGDRAFSLFSLYVWDATAGVYQLLDSFSPPLPGYYEDFTRGISPVVGQKFRAEFTQYAGQAGFDPGPRVRELDAIAMPGPCPEDPVNDADGDGLADVCDPCPDIFNPVPPVVACVTVASADTCLEATIRLLQPNVSGEMFIPNSDVVVAFQDSLLPPRLAVSGLPDGKHTLCLQAPLSIGLNFAADEALYNSGQPTALDPEAHAGVEPQANWNNLSSSRGGAIAVADLGGAAVQTAVLVTWSTPVTWSSTGRGEENNGFAPGANRTLMTGYLDAWETTDDQTIVTVHGLDSRFTSVGYDVYVYFLGGVADYTPFGSEGLCGGAYTLGGTSKLGFATTNPSSFLDAETDPVGHVGNYLRFAGLTDPTFTLTANADPAVGGHMRAPLNAIQIVARQPQQDCLPFVKNGQGEMIINGPGECTPPPDRPPVAKCRSVTTLVGADCVASVSLDDGSFDPDDDPITVTQDPPGPYPPGSTLVQLTATSSQGLSSSCSAVVEVVDPLLLQCPVDIWVVNDPGRCDAVVNYAVTAESCSEVWLVCNPTSGSAFPVGTTRVACEAVNGAGSMAYCTLNVTVEDRESPVMVCPAPIVAHAAPGQCSQIVTFDPMVADNCDRAEATGMAWQELYFEIDGVTLAELRAAPKYPAAPDLVRWRSSLEANAADEFDNYGTRIRGLLIPPQSGDYVFYLASDDQGEFWLSTDSSPSRLFLIAREPSWSSRRNFVGEAEGGGRGDPPSNISAPIPLQAGQRYYFEALMKEAGGGDNLAVAWQMPGGPSPTDGSDPIGGQYLVGQGGLPQLVCVPASGSAFPIGTTLVTCTATDSSGNTAQCTFPVTVKDAGDPTVNCIPTVNPAGANVPNAGKNAKSGQNPDGFYELVATDDCDGMNLAIYVKDSAEGPCGGTFVAGPYPPGTKVKLTQSRGQSSVKPMAGAIVAHINTKGDPVLVVTDRSGNTTCHPCGLPPTPK